MSLEPLRAIVFDLDGTLIDSAVELATAVNGALARYKLPSVTVSQVKMMIGDGAMALTQRAFAASGRRLTPEGLAEALQAFREEYALQPPSAPYPGVRETIERLADMGVALAVCTNKPEKPARHILGQLGMTKYFKVIAGGDSFPTKKPDPGPLQALIDAVGVPASAAAMVGDSANDVTAGRVAGMFTVAVSYGYSNTPAAELGADRLIHNFADLLTALSPRLTV